MNKNLIALKKACTIENIDFCTYHNTKNIVTIDINGDMYIFTNWTTPLNSQSIMKLCQDKDYFYSMYKDVVRMAKTHSYLNPYVDEKYRKYLNESTIFEIINNIKSKYKYPFIVKQNSGTWGNNVFKVNNLGELEKSILAIFNQQSYLFDYVCLVQDFIDIEKEFRVIYLNGIYQFAYEKTFDKSRESKFEDNLSPLHQENSKAIILHKKIYIKKIKKICAPIFEKLMIPFCGLDIALDKNGNYWLIEANSAPGFDKIIKDEGYEIIIELYQKVIKILKKSPTP